MVISLKLYGVTFPSYLSQLYAEKRLRPERKALITFFSPPVNLVCELKVCFIKVSKISRSRGIKYITIENSCDECYTQTAKLIENLD